MRRGLWFRSPRMSVRGSRCPQHRAHTRAQETASCLASPPNPLVAAHAAKRPMNDLRENAASPPARGRETPRSVRKHGRQRARGIAGPDLRSAGGSFASRPMKYRTGRAVRPALRRPARLRTLPGACLPAATGSWRCSSQDRPRSESSDRRMSAWGGTTEALLAAAPAPDPPQAAWRGGWTASNMSLGEVGGCV